MIQRLKTPIQGRFFMRLLLYFVVIGFVPLILFSYITYASSYETAKRQLERQTESTADIIAAELDAHLADYEAQLKVLAEDEKIRAFVRQGYGAEGGEALHSLYGVMSGMGGYVAAHVVSSDVEASLSTMTVPVNYLPPYNRNWGIFRTAAAEEGPVFRAHDNNPNALSGVKFSMAMAIRGEEGSVTGYVVFDVFSRMLDELIAGHDQEYRMNVYLGDPYHFVIYSSAPSYSGGALSRIPPYLLAVGDDGGAREHTANAETWYLYEASPARYGIRVFGEMPLAYAAQTSHSVRNAALAACIICTALCALFTLVAWRDVSMPLQKLTAAIGQVERGNLHARVDMEARTDEFGKLGENFNRMAAETEVLIRNVQEEQRRLRIAESSALQAQVNPHFLYNTLDLIKWNAKLNNTGEVAKIAVLLGKLLRASANFDRDIVTVAEERALIRNYLEIQQIHYGGRLTVVENIPPALEDLHIPKLILQPVVENAVVHGITGQKRQCFISITASYQEPYIQFEIADNGAGIPPETLAGLLSAAEKFGSIGLRNVHRRARLHGDGTCGLEIESAVGAGTRVSIRLKCLGGAEGAEEDAYEEDYRRRG